LRRMPGVHGIFYMFSGGALSRVTIFALASCRISALPLSCNSDSVIPAIGKLAKEGDAGRKKIGQYTRYGTVVIAAIQSFGIAAGLEKMQNDSLSRTPVSL